MTKRDKTPETPSTPAKRGAKPAPAPAPAAPLDGELLAERRQQLAVMGQHQRDVIEQFGDGLPWSPEHYETEIRLELRRGCESFLRAGRYLVVARECATHGEWAELLDRLGLEGSQSRRMMEAARRMAALPNRATSHDLLAKVGDKQSKLIELLSLDDDQFSELAVTGETGELELDDVAAMTVKELRQAIRKARGLSEKTEKKLAKRDAEIENLERERDRARYVLDRATPDETTAKLREQCSHATLQARVDLLSSGDETNSLMTRFRHLREHASTQGNESAHDDFMAGLIGELFNDLRQLRGDMALPVVNDDGADWMKSV